MNRAYHYGPYSDTLDEDLEGLAMAGAIEEHRTLLGHNVRGPVRMHRFELTQQGWQRLHQLRSERPDEVEHVERIVRTIRETAGSLNQQLLSQAAKTHFVAGGLNREADRTLLDELAKAHGWKLNPKQSRQVEDLLAAILPESGAGPISPSK